jgi:hypothetical protein
MQTTTDWSTRRDRDGQLSYPRARSSSDEKHRDQLPHAQIELAIAGEGQLILQQCGEFKLQWTSSVYESEWN